MKRGSTDMTPQELGKMRQAMHTGDTNWPRYYEDENVEHIRGAVGELQFSRDYGYPVDLSLKRGGDRGIDFRTPLGTIDTKTGGKPKRMLVKKRQTDFKMTDIYIQLEDNGDDTASYLGWEWDSVVRVLPIGLYHKQEQRMLPLSALRPMAEFNALLKEAEDQADRPSPSYQWVKGSPEEERRNGIIDQMLKSYQMCTRRELAEFLVWGEHRDKMPAKLITAQAALLKSLNLPAMKE